MENQYTFAAYYPVMIESSLTAEEMLRDLIAIPSVTGSEGLIRGYLERKFREMGLATEAQHVDTDRYNVVGKTGDGPIGLMLCSHQDVIPALDEAKWHTPPFSPVFLDGRVYGRGATDAKGPLAAMMEAVARVAGRVDGCAAIAAVVEEETARSLGARRLLEQHVPAQAVIGEPTGLAVGVAHKGAIWPTITVHGRAAHGSTPGEGKNAIGGMARVLGMLEDYGKQVSAIGDPFLGPASSEVTVIRGGDRVNVIPEQCTVCLDRRLVSSETVDGAFEDLRRQVEAFAKESGLQVDVCLDSSYPSASIGEGEPIVRTTLAALADAGVPGVVRGFPAGCDMWAFRALDIPTVVLGPGNMEQAHVIDEYLDLRQLRLAADVYERLLMKVL